MAFSNFFASGGGVSIDNDSDNRVITAKGDGNLNAEADLTFSGGALGVGSGEISYNAQTSELVIKTSNTDALKIGSDQVLDFSVGTTESANASQSIGTTDPVYLKIEVGGSVHYLPLYTI